MCDRSNVSASHRGLSGPAGDRPHSLAGDGGRRRARGIRDIYNAEDIDKAQMAIKTFEIDDGAADRCVQ